MLCPAKINLGLQVHHRRESDGYHYITSIFIPISFADEMQIEPNDHADQLVSSIKLSNAQARDYIQVSEHGNLEANVVWKILQATRSYRSAEYLEVHLTKRIPTGAGLGGGSSDAGCLLRYLGERYAIPRSMLNRIAETTGADISFFLATQAALVSGIGEICEPVAIGAGQGVLCMPGIAINTTAAYRLLKRTLQAAPSPKCMQGLEVNAYDALKNSDWSQLFGLVNDFEQPVFALHPEIGAVKDTFLMQGADFALMSGSGATVYGLVQNQIEQQKLLELMQDRFPKYDFVPFRFEANPII